MHYTRFQVTCNPTLTEILIAEFSEAGFETFLEKENGFEAYVEGEKFDLDRIEELREKYRDDPFTYSTEQIPKKNWNEEWEKNYEPVLVDDTCLIRADFHIPSRTYPYEIIITPKMSFGTGHHQTTHLMIHHQLNIDHRNKRVMDAGCGTAILSVMASKRGAREVVAFDIDEWSVTNGAENISINNCRNITLRRGTIREINPGREFDIVLANINKNVLLDEMELYSQSLNSGGLLLLSGFYRHDVPDLVNAAGAFGLKPVHESEREGWAAVLLKKS